MIRKICLIFAMMGMFGLTCCGYNFSPGGEDIDPAVRKIYVDNFTNPTAEPYVETYLRNGLITEFRRSQRFTIANDRQEADAVVSGHVIGIQTGHVSFSETNIAKEDRIDMAIAVEFQMVEGKMIWANKNLPGREVYTVGSDPSATERNKERALRKLAVDLAQKAYRSMMSGF